MNNRKGKKKPKKRIEEVLAWKEAPKRKLDEVKAEEKIVWTIANAKGEKNAAHEALLWIRGMLVKVERK